MTPLEQKLDRLCGLLERLLDRGTLEEHEQMRVEIIHLHNDHKNLSERVERESERTDELEDMAEQTGEVFKSEAHEKIKKYEENERHWSRYAISGAVGIFFAGLSILIGYLLHAPH